LVSGFLANIVSYQVNTVSYQVKIVSCQVFFGFLWRELLQILFSKTRFDNNKSCLADKNSYWSDLNRYYPDKIHISHIEINIRVAINDISLIDVISGWQ
jgi:hypothetical protein